MFYGMKDGETTMQAVDRISDTLLADAKKEADGKVDLGDTKESAWMMQGFNPLGCVSILCSDRLMADLLEAQIMSALAQFSGTIDENLGSDHPEAAGAKDIIERIELQMYDTSKGNCLMVAQVREDNKALRMLHTMKLSEVLSIFLLRKNPEVLDMIKMLAFVQESTFEVEARKFIEAVRKATKEGRRMRLEDLVDLGTDVPVKPPADPKNEEIKDLMKTRRQRLLDAPDEPLDSEA